MTHCHSLSRLFIDVTQCMVTIQNYEEVLLVWFGIRYALQDAGEWVGKKERGNELDWRKLVSSTRF